MKFCTRHWDELKDEINKAGLGKFMVEDEVQAEKMHEHDYMGGRKISDNFEPLYGARNSIFRATVNATDYSVVQSNVCPICECVDAGIPEGDWIKGAVGDEVKLAKIFRLISNDQSEKNNAAN